jgi:predicted DNA-binding transcriptional regulator AlpA
MNQQDNSSTANERYAKQAEVLELTSLSANTIRNLEKQGKFPKRRNTSIRAVRWWLPDVLEWMKNPAGWKAA